MHVTNYLQLLVLNGNSIHLLIETLKRNSVSGLVAVHVLTLTILYSYWLEKNSLPGLLEVEAAVT